jgi:hypothetical protein
MKKKPKIRNNPVGIYQKQILGEHPFLNVFYIHGMCNIKGTLVIRDDQNHEIDKFKIEIQIPPDFPQSVPSVREIGGRIPNNGKQHINPDGTACLFVPEEKYRYCPDGISLSDFINGPVRNFFLWQIDYELNGGNSSIGERAHGFDGRIEFYQEILNTKDGSKIIKFVKLLTLNHINGNSKCWCGSNKSVHSCTNHFNELKFWRANISQKIAQDFLSQPNKESAIRSNYPTNIIVAAFLHRPPLTNISNLRQGNKV